MHPRIDQLLSLRDGTPVEAAVARHAEACAACREALASLVRRTSALRELRQLDAPDGSWERIRGAIQKPQKHADHRRLFAIAASVIAVLSLSIAFIAGRENAPREQSTVTIVVRPVELSALVARSRELEDLLQDLPLRPRIERVSTASTIDTIEERIQWLDFQLSNTPDLALNDAQQQQLWSERVTLMDSLVKVRYAESSRVSF